MFYQTEPQAPIDFQKYGCLFSVLRHAPEFLYNADVTLEEGVQDWIACRAHGLISGDLNQDGDYDDPGEDVIQDFNGIFNLLHLPLYYPNQASLGLPMLKDHLGTLRIAPLKRPLDPSKYYVVEHWFWKYGHFVLGGGMGLRPVIYDPIRGGSYSVRNGVCIDLRVFEIQE